MKPQSKLCLTTTWYKMTKYRFNIRNIGMDLSEPTVAAFEKFFETMFLKVLIGDELKKMIIEDLQTLIDIKSYEVIEDEPNWIT